MGYIIAVEAETPDTILVKRETEALFRDRLPQAARAKAGRILHQLGIERRHLILPAQDLLRQRTFEARQELSIEFSSALATRAARRAMDRAGVDPSRVGQLILCSSALASAEPVVGRITAALGLDESVRVISLSGLGCSGSLRAISLACRTTREEAAYSLVVCAEVCSPWWHPWTSRTADILSNATFGDAATAVLVGNDERERAGFELVWTATESLPDCKDVRGVDLTDQGLRHYTSPRFSAVLRSTLDRLRARFSSETLADVRLVIPGPAEPRIMKIYRDALGLPEASSAFSSSVWQQYGNTASCGPLLALRLAVSECPAAVPFVGAMVCAGSQATCDFVALREAVPRTQRSGTRTLAASRAMQASHLVEPPAVPFRA